MIYYEDVPIDECIPLGSISVTRQALLSFAQRYDPQSFHLSDAGATDTYFGSLAASGWHTVALTMKLFMTGYGDLLAGLDSRGIDDLRWRYPVYPGDVLATTASATYRAVSNLQPSRGLVQFALETCNQDEHTVLTLTHITLISMRDL